MATPQMLVETILRARIYESRYWKEECFALNAESVVDKAVELDHVGGQRGNLIPTRFLCLVLKLLQLLPPLEIILEYISNQDFKYLTALGAFYLRLVAAPADIYAHLEPLLDDRRKLRLMCPLGTRLSYMDEFADTLLHEPRACDIILPRLPPRRNASDFLAAPRVSPLFAEFEASLPDGDMLSLYPNHDVGNDNDSDNDSDNVKDDGDSNSSNADGDGVSETERDLSYGTVEAIGSREFRVNERKVAKLFKRAPKKAAGVSLPPQSQHSGKRDIGSEGGGGDESLSVERTNELRKKLGLAPLKL